MKKLEVKKRIESTDSSNRPAYFFTGSNKNNFYIIHFVHGPASMYEGFTQDQFEQVYKKEKEYHRFYQIERDFLVDSTYDIGDKTIVKDKAFIACIIQSIYLFELMVLANNYPGEIMPEKAKELEEFYRECASINGISFDDDVLKQKNIIQQENENEDKNEEAV